MLLRQIRCADIRLEEGARPERAIGVDELAESIRLHGILRPVLVRETSDRFVIVHGERRWRAACQLGMDSIPAYVVEPSPSSPAAGAIVSEV